MSDNIKYWIGACAFIALFILTGILFYLSVFHFSSLPPFHTQSFVILCLVYLIKYLLDTQNGVHARHLGARIAKSGAENVLDTTHDRHELAVQHREFMKEKSRIQQERYAKTGKISGDYTDWNNEFEEKYRPEINYNKAKTLLGKMIYYCGVYLPFLALTFLPAVIFVAGFFCRHYLIGSILLSYGSSVLSIVYGIFTIRFFKAKGYALSAVISAIGLIATVIATIAPPFQLSDILHSAVITMQMGYVGVVSNPKKA